MAEQVEKSDKQQYVEPALTRQQRLADVTEQASPTGSGAQTQQTNIS